MTTLPDRRPTPAPPRRGTPRRETPPPRRASLAARVVARLLLAAFVAGVVAFVVAWGRDVTTAGDRLVGAGDVRTAEHGYVPEDSPLSVLDDEAPAMARLDPDLRAAIRAAAADAASSGVDMVVTSGWRSAEYQQHLLDEAVQKYGSLEEARRLVSTPELSHHVTGKAIDIGPTAADYWLLEHGTDYGLCQVYANEIWHFERVTEPGGRCPELLPDATT